VAKSWGKRGTHPQVRELLQQYQAKFAAGDMHYLLLGLDLCFRTGIRVPMAFRQAFCDRLLPWFDNEVRSLDDALGVQRPKGKHLRDHARLIPLIKRRVNALRKQDVAVDKACAKVGDRLGISGKTIQRLYYGRPPKRSSQI
jgi:hypothetical protein